ncbi:MAG TPA: efflux RND transporter periplasmic adaptor subunit, partial [Candidatus Gracilibacteria bacterium]|nr:efflux RND transporter periplasmic adaptor subunit [Candidatus Gracilibacteria bacterium]
QLIAQLNQAESQNHSLYTTIDSTAARLGLDGNTTDQVKLAQQGLEAAKVQSSAAVTQAKTQLDLAELNLEMAADQQKMLLVKAPVDGKIDSLSAAVGQAVSPQNVLARIVNSNTFVLEVGVDIENAENLVVGDMAKVEIGDKFMDSPILSIAPSAGAQSRLVNVRVRLPKIGFRENQSLRVQLPLNTDSLEVHGFYIPLDSVIIGSQEQFVYIVENGKAKQVTVELGDINGSLVQIVGGELKESDQLIVDGAKEVKEGQTVIIS